MLIDGPFERCKEVVQPRSERRTFDDSLSPRQTNFSCTVLKTVFSCPYRKSNPNALVVQSAEMRFCEDPTDALNFARDSNPNPQITATRDRK